MSYPPTAKYRNKRTLIDGVLWDSRAEYQRWKTLRTLQDQGLIRNLRRQVRFPFEINGVLVCTYVADFTYEKRSYGFVVEDVKGFPTPVYKLKKRLLKAIYKIEIREV